MASPLRQDKLFALSTQSRSGEEKDEGGENRTSERVEDESIADLNYVKPILEDAEKVECGAVVEALKDVSWTTINIEINVN